MTAPLPVVLAQTARPGDTLILTFAGPLSLEEADRMQDELRANIPDSIKILVIDQCTGAVIVRPDAGD